MSDQDLLKLLEVQYLKGRLDELHKAFPTVLDLHRSRKLDSRIEKYYNKLKSTSEEAYYLYLIERQSHLIAKNKSKKIYKELFSEILDHISDPKLIEKINKKISSL